MPSSPAEREALRLALDHLEADGLVAFPTETSWGIAASARSETAVDRLRSFKGRDRAQPISVIISSPAALDALGCAVSGLAQVWVDAFWPGPLTLVLACDSGAGNFAPGILSASGGLGVRCSPHAVAAALALGAEERGLGPLTATSCNESGSPAAQTRAEARRVCGEAASAPHVIAAGADAGGETPSTVVEVLDEPCVLREGAISKQRLLAALAERGIELTPGVTL